MIQWMIYHIRCSSGNGEKWKATNRFNNKEMAKWIFNSWDALWMSRLEIPIWCPVVFSLMTEKKFIVNCTSFKTLLNYKSCSKAIFPAALFFSELLKHSVVISVINIFCNWLLSCLSLPNEIEFLRLGTILLILNLQFLAQHRTHAYI